MPLNLPVLYKRTVSAIVFGIVMLSGLLWKNDIGYSFLMLIINFLCLREYFSLAGKITNIEWPGWLKAAVLTGSTAILLLFSLDNFLPGLRNIADSAIQMILLLLPVYLIAVLLVSVLSKQQSVTALMLSCGGLFYVTVPAIMLLLLRSVSYHLPIFLIAMIWVNDTMAYLVGSMIGKTPFSPISPKKTWEGTGGGAVLAVMSAGVYAWFTHKEQLIHYLALAAIAAVVGTMGDLVESKLKRLAGVKDSGNMMPGHGGALDRFDSLIVAAPVFAIYVYIFLR